jgi:hypothetical protein
MPEVNYMQRKLCKGCDIIAEHKTTCARCGHNQFLTSDQLPDGWVTHQKNQQLIEELETTLNQVKETNDKFEKTWFKNWNNSKAVQREFEEPEPFSQLWIFFGI